MIGKAVVLPVVLALVVAGCVKVRPVPAEPKTTDYRIPKPREEVFDAAVAVGQRMNLDVPVLEKGSGFLRFEYTNVNAGGLDRYCEYPYVSKKTDQAFETFTQWDEHGPVTGIVQLVLVVSADGPTTTNIAIRSRCKVVAPGESRPRGYRDVLANDCNSLGVLEREFVDAVEGRLGLP